MTKGKPAAAKAGPKPTAGRVAPRAKLPLRTKRQNTGGGGIGLRILVAVGFTLVLAGLGAAYPLFARGDAWRSAQWQYPWALLLLALVPVVWWRSTFGEDLGAPRLRLGSLVPLGKWPRGTRVWFRDLPGIARAVAFTLMVGALARPVSMFQPESSDEEGIDIVIVLDLSGSMEAVLDNLPQDLKQYATPKQRRLRPTRLDAAKAVIRDFISRRKTDRIGVVVFGKSAYVLSPPTLDYHLLDLLVSKMELSLIDPSGTAIGDAVGVAVARLRRSHAESKAVILLTDGDNKGGKLSPEYSAHLATVVGAKLYTIQIGEEDAAAEVYAGTDLFGQPRYATKMLPTNPQLLKDLAAKTGGEMYVASDAAALQASFHDVLNQLEKTRFEASSASFEDLYRFLLLPGVLLLALDALLRSLWFRRFP